MTPLRKLELGAGVVTFLLAIYLIYLTPSIGIIYGLPGTLTGYGAYRHATTQARWAHFLIGVGVLGIVGGFVFLLLVLAFKRIDDLWTFMNLALAISALTTFFLSLSAHSQDS